MLITPADVVLLKGILKIQNQNSSKHVQKFDFMWNLSPTQSLIETISNVPQFASFHPDIHN